MKTSYIFINHFKETWTHLSEEEQTRFGARIHDAAERLGVRAVVGYKLSTPGAVLEIWEADQRATLEQFHKDLDALGYKNYFDYALLIGTRADEWRRE